MKKNTNIKGYESQNLKLKAILALNSTLKEIKLNTMEHKNERK